MSQLTGKQGTVLIVEDDHNTAALVAAYLEREGFSTVVIHDGGEAIKAASLFKFVFVILDVMLPNVDGWEICRTLRKDSDVPIIMLTAREEELDRVAGLAMGADDYVVKPFSPRELVERVKAILRRSKSLSQRSALTLSFSGLVLDPEKHRVARNGRPIMLTSSEFKILHALMSLSRKGFFTGGASQSLLPARRGGDRPGHRCARRQAPAKDRGRPFQAPLHPDGAGPWLPILRR